MSNRQTVRWTALGIAMVCGAACGNAAVPIAEGGAARAVIVHNGHTAGLARDGIKPAVEELRDYLRQITGAELPLVATLAEAGDRATIIVKLVERLPNASAGPTGRQAYHLKTEGNRLTLTAENLLGVYSAVYGLLEDHLGCRFYTVRRRFAAQGAAHYLGPGYEIVPQRPTLELPSLDDFQEPSFASRGLIFSMGTYPWVLKNRAIGHGNSVSGAINSQHNLYGIIPPHDQKRGEEVVRKGLFAEHP